MAVHRPSPLVAPSQPPRRFSSQPFPAYRHVPGSTPHPVTNPAGHSFGVSETLPSRECFELPEAWRECSEYLYGVDLFNRAYFWEAHEAWEVVWHAVGATAPTGRFVQGLIQISASLLRRHVGTPKGAWNLHAKALENLAAIGSGEPRHRQLESYMGIALDPWLSGVKLFLGDPNAPYPFITLKG